MAIKIFFFNKPPVNTTFSTRNIQQKKHFVMKLDMNQIANIAIAIIVAAVVNEFVIAPAKAQLTA